MARASGRRVLRSRLSLTSNYLCLQLGFEVKVVGAGNDRAKQSVFKPTPVSALRSILETKRLRETVREYAFYIGSDKVIGSCTCNSVQNASHLSVIVPRGEVIHDW